MIVKIRLADADRELYGGDEWLVWDPNQLRVSEAEALEEHLGILPENYRGPAGWLRTGGANATKWVLWLCLRRAGTTVDWAGFDPDIFGARVIEDPKPEAPAGKAPSRAARPRRSGSAAKSSPQT